jgi:hypothetical protein
MIQSNNEKTKKETTEVVLLYHVREDRPENNSRSMIVPSDRINHYAFYDVHENGDTLYETKLNAVQNWIDECQEKEPFQHLEGYSSDIMTYVIRTQNAEKVKDFLIKYV